MTDQQKILLEYAAKSNNQTFASAIRAALAELEQLRAERDNLIDMLICPPGKFEHPAVDEDDPNPTLWAAYDFEAEDAKIRAFPDRAVAVAYVRKHAKLEAEAR